MLNYVSEVDWMSCIFSLDLLDRCQMRKNFQQAQHKKI